MGFRMSMVVIVPALLASVAHAQPNVPISVMVRELETPASIGSAEPNLVLGRDGFIYMSWIQKNPDTSHTLFFSRFDSAGWVPARPIQSGKNWFVNWADFPALAVGESGMMLASWLEKSGEDTYAYDVKLSHSRDGGRTWGTSFSPHNDKTETEHGFVSLVAMPEREFTAVWLDGRQMVKPDGPMSLRSARIDGDGKLLKERLIDPKVCDCCQTSMARCSDGSLVVAYRDRHDDELRDIAILRHEKDEWTTPAPLHTDNWRIAGCPVNGPSLDAYEQNVCAAWFTMEAGDSARVYAAFSTNSGETFAAPVRVDTGLALGRVDVVMLDRSRAGVLWLQSDSTNAHVMFRVVTSAGTMSRPLTVAKSSANRESGFPRIAFDGAKIMVVWTDPSAQTIKAAQLLLE